MKIEHLYQPYQSNLCGQTCVAMVVGRKIEDVIAIIGRGKTRTSDLKKALNMFDFYCSDRAERIRKEQSLPQLAIARLHYTGIKESHWTVICEGKFYDPAYGITDKYPDGVYATSFLRINKEAT